MASRVWITIGLDFLLNRRPLALFTNLSFHTASWTQRGLRYFVLGDVSSEQIESLAGLLRGAS